MTYAQFREIVLSLDDYSDDNFDLFIAERGWQEWMEEYIGEDDNANRIVEILTIIWGMRENPIRGIQAATNLTNKALSEQYGYHISSIEQWRSGAKRCPANVYIMLAYCAFGDAGII